MDARGWGVDVGEVTGKGSSRPQAQAESGEESGYNPREGNDIEVGVGGGAERGHAYNRDKSNVHDKTAWSKSCGGMLHADNASQRRAPPLSEWGPGGATNAGSPDATGASQSHSRRPSELRPSEALGPKESSASVLSWGHSDRPAPSGKADSYPVSSGAESRGRRSIGSSLRDGVISGFDVPGIWPRQGGGIAS
ncbi:unnamed protein product, partial [Discosporangium mesarthrocarpum]